LHSCHSCGFYCYRFSIDLDKSRELEIGIYWRDWRSLCAIKFLRLEEFIDDIRHGMALQLEPQGLLFAEVINPAQCKNILCNFVAIYLFLMCSHLIEFVTFITSSSFGYYHWVLLYRENIYCVIEH
jgi:hypothetical protein